jgi:hypothetical protein
MTLTELYNKAKADGLINPATECDVDWDTVCDYFDVVKSETSRQQVTMGLNAGSMMRSNQMTLTELRIWHWERVESHRASQRKYEQLLKSGDPAKFYNERKVADHNRYANFHIKCVQALNDVLATTVHQDIATAKEKK